jgi:beta-glucosidase
MRLTVRSNSLCRLVLILIFALAPCTAGLLMAQPAAPGTNIFTAETAARADQLLKQMTPEEKLGQLEQMFYFDPLPWSDAEISKGRIGSVLFVTDPREINRLQHLAVDNTRLHIPLIFGFDVIHGYRTIFPVPLAMASSWDMEMIERAQTVAAAEARSSGIDWAFAPMVDIARDPRWGRIVEGAGEDPYLGSAVAQAQVRGFQGAEIGAPHHLLACMKHFAGYGAAEGGRDYDASYISDAQLHNVYLQPFHAAVNAGVGSAMSAYEDLNDVPASGNRWLLTTVLRDDWKFKGFVVSDADAVNSLANHGFAKDKADAGLRGFRAGVNMEMTFPLGHLDQGVKKNGGAYATLAEALKNQQITMAEIDARVKPILEAKIQMGLFEHPYADVVEAEKIMGDPEHRKEALRAAERSMVLLRNEGNLLPLKRSEHKRVAVIGPLATNGHDMVGSWAFVFDPRETVPLLDGVRAKLNGAAQVEYTQGAYFKRLFPSFFDDHFHIKREPLWTAEQAKAELDKAVELARSSDLVILALGETQDMSGESASSSSLDLPGDQQKLMEAVVATGKPVVLVLVNGRPLNITWASTHVPAILEAWHPGTMGGAAIANLLFGDAVPGGKLPLSWPRNVGQIPINYAHNLTQDAAKQGTRYWNEPSTPLYPFGYGLSYSSFAFSNLKIDRAESKVGEPIHVSVEVENTGAVAADEVAQLYIHQQYGRASRPVRELKGFRRVKLAPHEKTAVEFALTSSELRYWSAADRDWVEDASVFDLWVGDSSAATLHGSFERKR